MLAENVLECLGISFIVHIIVVLFTSLSSRFICSIFIVVCFKQLRMGKCGRECDLFLSYVNGEGGKYFLSHPLSQRGNFEDISSHSV